MYFAIKKQLNNFPNMLKNKFVVDLIWNISSFGLVILSVTLINIFVGNHYGAGGLGVFNYAFSVYTVLSALTIFGLKSSITKHLAEYKGRKEESKTLVFSALVLVLTTSIILTALFLLLTSQFIASPNVNVVSLYYVIIALPVFSINEVLMGLLNGQRKMKEYAILRASRWILVFCFVLYIIFQRKNVELTLFAFLFTESMLLIILLLLNRGQIWIKKPNYDWLKKHGWFGFKASLIQFINALDNRVSVLLVGYLLTSVSTGIYTFAFTVTSGMIMIPSIIALNFNPIISNLWSKDRKALINHFKTLKKGAYIITALSALGIGLVYPFFVKFFMKGSVYNESIPIFYALLVGVIFISSVIWKGGFLPMIGKPGKQVRIRLLSLAINVLLNLLFIPKFGLFGAAMATALSGVIFSIILNTAIKKELLIKV